MTETSNVRLSDDEVNYIANLSRLHLSQAERDRAATELSQILDSFEKLKELDTEGVEPTDHVLPVVNVPAPTVLNVSEWIETFSRFLLAHDGDPCGGSGTGASCIV